MILAGCREKIKKSAEYLQYYICYKKYKNDAYGKRSICDDILILGILWRIDP